MEEAVLTLLGSLMVAMIMLIFASMRMHHRDSLATRDEIARTNLETREYTAGQIEKSLGDLKRITEKNHDDLKRMVQDNHKESQHQLANIRERLARLEGPGGPAGAYARRAPATGVLPC